MKPIDKKTVWWKPVILGVGLTALIGVAGYLTTSFMKSGEVKANEAVWKSNVTTKLESLEIRQNTTDIDIKDFKETMIEYAQRQEKMYIEVKDNQRLQTKILEKIDKKVGVAGDLIEELKDRETAKEEVILNHR